MKMIPDEYRSLFEREVLINLDIKHPYFVKFIESFEDQLFIDHNEEQVYVNCLVFEYAPNGDLYEYISNKKINIDLTRKFFNQLIIAIKYLHSKGYCHLDLKPENILIGANHTI